MSIIYMCNEKRESIQITVTADITGDCLKISGQDLGHSDGSKPELTINIM